MDIVEAAELCAWRCADESATGHVALSASALEAYVDGECMRPLLVVPGVRRGHMYSSHQLAITAARLAFSRVPALRVPAWR